MKKTRSGGKRDLLSLRSGANVGPSATTSSSDDDGAQVVEVVCLVH